MAKEDNFKYRKYNAFLKAVSDSGVLIESIFSDLDVKEGLVKKFMYEGLTGGGKLDDVSDAQLGQAFRNMVRTAQRFVERYEHQRAERFNAYAQEKRRKRLEDEAQRELFDLKLTPFDEDD